MKLSRQEIDIISRAIDLINSESSFARDALSQEVEDVNLFLNTLIKLKPTRLRKLLSPKVGGVSSKKLTVWHYDKAMVAEIFSTKTLEEIVKQYSLSNLQSMYVTVFNTTPLTKYTKSEVAAVIKKQFHQIERVEAFHLDKNG